MPALAPIQPIIWLCPPKKRFAVISNAMPTASATPVANGDFRFLLYNIRYGAGASPIFHLPVPGAGYLRGTKRNLGRISHFLCEHKPHVVGLIEVDTGSYRSGHRNQAEVLADALGHQHTWRCKYAAQSVNTLLPVVNKQGNAFLTSLPVVTTRFHYFDAGIKRLAIELELEQVTCFLVHLSLKFRHRHYQLRHLHDLVKSTDKPVIIGGDFNTLRGATELDLFRSACGLVTANLDSRPSWPSRRPRRQLDFVLHSPQLELTNFSIPDVNLSDHLPLVCDFRLRH